MVELRAAGLILLFCVGCPFDVAAFFKMTAVKCESFNQSWAVFKQCRLRPFNRAESMLNIHMDLLHPANVIDLNGTIVKRALGGYKPFVLQFDIDCCKFVKRSYNPIAKEFYRLFREYSNVNHSCPYDGAQILHGFYLRHDRFNIPLPNGDYALLLTWSLHKQKTFVTNVYFTFSSD